MKQVPADRDVTVEGMRADTASPWPEPEDELDLDDYDDEIRLPITLTPAQRADLRAVLDRDLLDGGRDNTLRIAKQWADGARVPWPRLRRELQVNGGYCDCEIIFNVITDEDPP
jgi:hypothetical protein